VPIASAHFRSLLVAVSVILPVRRVPYLPSRRTKRRRQGLPATPTDQTLGTRLTVSPCLSPLYPCFCLRGRTVRAVTSRYKPASRERRLRVFVSMPCDRRRSSANPLLAYLPHCNCAPIKTAFGRQVATELVATARTAAARRPAACYCYWLRPAAAIDRSLYMRRLS